MKLATIVLAFLAARAPAAFTEAAIATRINASGLADFKVTESDINNTCGLLSLERVGGLVDSDVGAVTKEVVWYATDAGVRQWARDGRMYVGG